MKKHLFVSLMYFLCAHVIGQENSDVQFLENNSTILFSWENDILVKTDKYYTNGASFALLRKELAIPLIDRFLSIPLTRPTSLQSLEIQQNMYTPEEMFEEGIQYGDRPYAGYLVISYKLISHSSEKMGSSWLTIGAIGSLSGAQSAQDFVHSFDDMQAASGWEYQVSNAPIINVGYRYEKMLVNCRFVELSYSAMADIGSLKAQGMAGCNLKIGYIVSDFGVINRKDLTEAYIFFNREQYLNLYNATLQGSIFTNATDPYTISNSEFNYLSNKISLGATVSLKGFFTKIGFSFISPEFKGASNHAWGSISIGYSF